MQATPGNLAPYTGRKTSGRYRMAKPPDAGGIKAEHDQSPVRAQHPINLAQDGMRVRRQLQCMGQQYRVDAVSRDRQSLGRGNHLGSLLRVGTQHRGRLCSGTAQKMLGGTPPTDLEQQITKDAFQSGRDGDLLLQEQALAHARFKPIYLHRSFIRHILRAAMITEAKRPE